MRKILLVLCPCLVFYCVNAFAETTNLVGKCAWAPIQSRAVSALQSTEKIGEANGLPEREKDYLEVTEKGRLYFYTLPNEICKSEIFIVKGDVVQIIDSYPSDDLSFSNSFARVMYYSKKMKGDVVGWVKMSSLRRLTESEKSN